MNQMKNKAFLHLKTKHIYFQNKNCEFLQIKTILNSSVENKKILSFQLSMMWIAFCIKLYFC